MISRVFRDDEKSLGSFADNNTQMNNILKYCLIKILRPAKYLHPARSGGSALFRGIHSASDAVVGLASLASKKSCCFGT